MASASKTHAKAGSAEANKASATKMGKSSKGKSSKSENSSPQASSTKTSPSSKGAAPKRRSRSASAARKSPPRSSTPDELFKEPKAPASARTSRRTKKSEEDSSDDAALPLGNLTLRTPEADNSTLDDQDVDMEGEHTNNSETPDNQGDNVEASKEDSNDTVHSVTDEEGDFPDYERMLKLSEGEASPDSVGDPDELLGDDSAPSVQSWAEEAEAAARKAAQGGRTEVAVDRYYRSVIKGQPETASIPEPAVVHEATQNSSHVFAFRDLILDPYTGGWIKKDKGTPCKSFAYASVKIGDVSRLNMALEAIQDLPDLFPRIQDLPIDRFKKAADKFARRASLNKDAGNQDYKVWTLANFIKEGNPEKSSKEKSAPKATEAQKLPVGGNYRIPKTGETENKELLDVAQAKDARLNSFQGLDALAKKVNDNRETLSSLSYWKAKSFNQHEEYRVLAQLEDPIGNLRGHCLHCGQIAHDISKSTCEFKPVASTPVIPPAESMEEDEPDLEDDSYEQAIKRTKLDPNLLPKEEEVPVRCRYPICGALTHLTSACPVLHGICRKCGLRGHQHGQQKEGAPSCPSNGLERGVLLRVFEKYAEQGLITGLRHELPTAGFFGIVGRAMEGLFKYTLSYKQARSMGYADVENFYNALSAATDEHLGRRPKVRSEYGETFFKKESIPEVRARLNQERKQVEQHVGYLSEWAEHGLILHLNAVLGANKVREHVTTEAGIKAACDELRTALQGLLKHSQEVRQALAFKGATENFRRYGFVAAKDKDYFPQEVLHLLRSEIFQGTNSNKPVERIEVPSSESQQRGPSDYLVAASKKPTGDSASANSAGPSGSAPTTPRPPAKRPAGQAFAAEGTGKKLPQYQVRDRYAYWSFFRENHAELKRRGETSEDYKRPEPERPDRKWEVTREEFEVLTPQAKTVLRHVLSNSKMPQCPNLSDEDINSIPACLKFRPTVHTFPQLGELYKDFVKIGVARWYRKDHRKGLFYPTSKNPQKMGT